MGDMYGDLQKSNFLLMNSSTFEEFLRLAEPQITVHDIHLLEAIPAGEISWLLSLQSM